MKSLAISAIALAFVSVLLPSAYSQETSSPPATTGATVRAGGLNFVLPSPGPDLVEAGSDYRVVLEPLSPMSNRLIAAYLTPDDLHTLSEAHNLPPLRHYAVVEIPRRAEFANVTPEIFQEIVGSMGKELAGDLTGTMQEQQQEVNRRLKDLGSGSSVTLQKPLPLGTLFSKTDECGFGMIMPVTTNAGTLKVAAGITVIRVHDRVLFAYLYTPYKDESSVASLKSVDEHWADAILRANQ